MLQVTLVKKSPAKPGLVIRTVPSPVPAQKWDKKQLDKLGFKGAAGSVLLLPASDGGAELLVGVGPIADLDSDGVRTAAAAAAKASGAFRSALLELDAAIVDLLGAGVTVAMITEGLTLGAYRFDRHKSSKDLGLGKVAILGTGDRAERDGLIAGLRVAEAVIFARDLINEPGGTLTATVAADRIAERATAAGLQVEVLGPKEIAAERLGGLLAVNQGSEEEARFVKLSWRPEGASGNLAFVGKGLTFDSGGLSIKPAEAMMTMKNDKGGAAAVAGAMIGIAELGLPVDVTAYLPFTDNMTGGAAIRPGDVYVARNGTTVEVLNTDAEGRLILAEALVMAAETKPDLIVNLATLTGACLVALGDRIAGLMGDDEVVSAVSAAAITAGERVWHMPLPADYHKQIESQVADLKNIGSRWGGSLTAGLFLKDFVAGVPFAHLDIAGPAFLDAPWEEGPAGGTGFGVRTLIELARASSAVQGDESGDE